MKKIFWFFIGFWLAFSLGIGISYAEWQARLTWTPSPDGDLRHYTVYVGFESRDYYGSYEADLLAFNGFTIPEVFEDGIMRYFTVTVSNWSGFESDYCNEVRGDGTHSGGPPDPLGGCYLETIRIE